MTVRGISLPFRRGALNFPAMTENEHVIRASLIMIVTTTRGERVMMPEFGINSYAYVFESLTPLARARIAEDVRQALIRNEPRAKIHDVTVSSTTGELAGMTIHIVYEYNGEIDDLDVGVSEP